MFYFQTNELGFTPEFLGRVSREARRVRLSHEVCLCVGPTPPLTLALSLALSLTIHGSALMLPPHT